MTRPDLEANFENELDAVYGLLTTAAQVIEDDDVGLEGLLEVGAECECEAYGLPPDLAAWWVADEAAYHIARAYGVPARDRDDPTIPLTLDALAREPFGVQVGVLRRAARRV